MRYLQEEKDGPDRKRTASYFCLHYPHIFWAESSELETLLSATGKINYPFQTGLSYISVNMDCLPRSKLGGGSFQVRGGPYHPLHKATGIQGRAGEGLISSSCPAHTHRSFPPLAQQSPIRGCCSHSCSSCPPQGHFKERDWLFPSPVPSSFYTLPSLTEEGFWRN